MPVSTSPRFAAPAIDSRPGAARCGGRGGAWAGRRAGGATREHGAAAGRVARWLAVAGLLAAVSAQAAHADGIGVIAAGAGRADRAEVASALVAAIGARGRVVGDAVGEARTQLAAGAVPAATLARFRRVREMIDDGWRAYLRAQIDFAHSRLAAARGEAEALVALPGGAELYADAALRLGVVLSYRRIADAPAVLALALALDPDRPITLAEFSPDVVDAVEAMRKAPVAATELRRVHVTTTPPGAIVAIDGKELGAAPLDAEVARGQHVVVARAPLHHAAAQGISVDGAATIELALERDGDALALAAGAVPGMAGPAEQALVDAALQLADVDEIVVAAVSDRRGGPTLHVQRCAGAPARCTAVVEIGFSEPAGLIGAAREAWQAVQGGTLRYPPTVIGAIGASRPPPRGCRLCRSPVVWTGVGAVVLGAVIAIVVTSGSKPAPVITIDGHDFGR
ncbi:MAG TPA: PEGA domain-containing protein [Kofleriaceae bacterium]|nr:PEGA domain-containing protein [Kofleriaceae bacterium]